MIQKNETSLSHKHGMIIEWRDCLEKMVITNSRMYIIHY